MSSVEAKPAIEEFVTFVVDVRARHSSCERIAESIEDVVAFLLADYGFLARRKLCRVFKLAYRIVQKPVIEYPSVDMSLDGCSVPPVVVTSCIRGVQSCLADPSYKHTFFSRCHRQCSRLDIDFIFDPWEGTCSGGHGAPVARYGSLFETHLKS